MKVKILVLIFIFLNSIILFANTNNIEIKSMDEKIEVKKLCEQEVYSSDECSILYSKFFQKSYINTESEYNEEMLSFYIFYVLSFLIILIYFLFIDEGYHHRTNYILLLVFFAITWGFIFYINFFEKLQQHRDGNNNKMISLLHSLEEINEQQIKYNQLIYKKLQNDTKTLSTIVDVLSESNRKNRNNSKTFKRLIEKLDENIQENNREMENIKELTPTATGTIIEIR